MRASQRDPSRKLHHHMLLHVNSDRKQTLLVKQCQYKGAKTTQPKSNSHSVTKDCPKGLTHPEFKRSLMHQPTVCLGFCIVGRVDKCAVIKQDMLTSVQDRKETVKKLEEMKISKMKQHHMRNSYSCFMKRLASSCHSCSLQLRHMYEYNCTCIIDLHVLSKTEF
jgi:hypothetical protein